MKNILFLLLMPIFSLAQNQADILIINGRIIDGTGNSWYYGDIAVKNGKIIKTGSLQNWEAVKVIDAKGKIVSPGFIDVHTHIEGDEPANPLATNFIYDGVTTVITGNCGSSETNLKKYFASLEALKLSINVASLIGHNDVRKAVMGKANREPTPHEMQQMKLLVEKAMQDGAVGFSTGLIYTPGTYSKTPEIIELAKVAARYHGVYASHMRSETDSVTQAIEEALTVGREANLPVQISHFKVGGQQNWGRSDQTLQMVKDARNAGLEVTIDQYPYTASATSLSTLLPEWVLADGQDSIVARLKKPAIRTEVKNELIKNLGKRKLQHWGYAVVANYKADSSLNGKSIEAINLLKGKKHTAEDEAETIVQMMEKGGASMVFHGMSEDDVKYIMQYPFNMFASDGGIREFGKGVPHPRSYGTNARVLGKYVREEKVLSLEEAIRRMTSLPAQKFGFNNRGLLKEGFAADILIFDEKEISEQSTFTAPHNYSKGIYYVLVNGVLTVDNGKHNGKRNGQVLLHQ